MQTLLILGDWSNDGHGRTEVVTVDHNLSSHSALNGAHTMGCKILGHNFANVVARAYECPYIPEEVLEALIEHKILMEVPEEEKTQSFEKGNRYWRLTGVVDSYCDWLSEYDDNFVIDSDLYAELWLRIAQLGEPSLTYTRVGSGDSNRITIGGYGLYE